MDRVRNEEVRRRRGIVKELAEQAQQGVMWWFGHVERMKEERLVRVTRSDVRCKAKRETSNGMAGQCEESIRCKRYVCGARKSACA